MCEVKYDFYCIECEKTLVLKEKTFECPICNSENVFCQDFIVCECGERVYLPLFTNVCKCGKLYNAFGQELADVDEMDPDDVYGSFGPICDLY